jgi:CBS-domain-containing membrane protein
VTRAVVGWLGSRPVAIPLAGIGAGLTIYILAIAHDWSQVATMVPSFGASCALVFAYPESPFARPFNVIGGHLVSSAIGLLTLFMLGSGPLALAVGVGLAIAGMMVTRTMHPPAGGDPLIVIATGASIGFLITPVLLGTVIVVTIGWAYHLGLMKARSMHSDKSRAET